MRLKFGILTLLVLVAVSANAMFAWKATIGRDPIRRTNNYRWHDNSICITERIYNGAFDYHDVVWGLGACLYLETGAFDTRTFDGSGRYVVGFQFSKDVSAGDVYNFSPIPNDRVAVQVSDSHTFSAMRPGEFTAFQYGNPQMDWMTDRDPPSTAKVTIEAMRSDTVDVHVKLHAVLPEMGVLDLDRKFTAVRIPSDV